MASELYLNAYIPSASEYDMYFNKFRAFVSARLSEKAKKNCAYLSHTYNAGYYVLRTAVVGSSDRIYHGYESGNRDWNFSSDECAGLRVAFQLFYNPECNLVKGCKTKTKTSLVWGHNKQAANIKITSKAPIVMFGGKECIWLNKDECESGKDKTMKLWTLEIVDCAEPFSKDGSHNDFGQAKELLEQCESALVEGCTKEELDMLVTVKMSKEDGYEKVEPILTTNTLNQNTSNATNTRVIDGRNGK